MFHFLKLIVFWLESIDFIFKSGSIALHLYLSYC